MAKSDYHYDPSPATSRNPISPVEIALSPIENAKFAPPEELAKIVDAVARERFELANKAFKDAGELRTTVVRDYSRLKFAVSGILDDESLTPGTRDRFKKLLEGPGPTDLRDPAVQATDSIAHASEALDRADTSAEPAIEATSDAPSDEPEVTESDSLAELAVYRGERSAAQLGHALRSHALCQYC